MVKKTIRLVFNLISRPFRELTSRWRKTPDFLIIGVQKGGTESLFTYLNQHPRIRMSVKKQIHFFDRNFTKSLSWYKSFFPFEKAGFLTGEATPYYIFHPGVPERVAGLFPDIKIIVLLRDPVNRAYSHFQMTRRRGYEPESDFAKAIDLEEERLKGESEKLIADPKYQSFKHQKFSYVSRGFYSEQLKGWFKYFDRKNFLILKSEEFFKDPADSLRKIYSFLGIEEYIPPDKRPRNVGKYPPMSDEVRKKLEKIYSEEVPGT